MWSVKNISRSQIMTKSSDVTGHTYSDEAGSKTGNRKSIWSKDSDEYDVVLNEDALGLTIGGQISENDV